MNVFRLLFFLFSIPAALASNYPVRVGDSIVYIRQIQNGKGNTYVHLHQNEKTALRAAEIMVAHQGGRLLTLVHRGGRNIVFHCHHHRYEFDPNRIFTDTGIQKTLKAFGNDSREARIEVKKLANKIKQLLPRGKIIAVHNNQSYSLKNYLPGHPLANDAHQLHVTKKHPYRNFYLVTQKKDYRRLKHLNFNSILQTEHATDDGSLSVYLAKRQYVNVEAGFDQLLPQLNMLRHA